ncbi:MAG: cytochrome c3 family protein [bacterium]
MKNKSFAILSLGVFLLITLFLNITVSYAVSAVNPDTDIIIINYKKIHGKNVFGPLTFTHKKHYVDYNLACIECHHEWKTNEKKDPSKCMECHHGKGRGTREGAVRNVDNKDDCCSLKDAFHLCCMDCHKTYQKLAYARITFPKWVELTKQYPKLEKTLKAITTIEDDDTVVIDINKIDILKRGLIGQKAYNELLNYITSRKRSRSKNLANDDSPPAKCKNCHGEK